MKRWTLTVILLAAAAVVGWLARRRSAPPEVPIARVKVETLVSILTTNGRTEPLEWAPARAELSGRVRQVLVERGGRVVEGAALAVLDNAAARAERDQAAAKLDQARAGLQVLERGGRAAEVAQVDAALRKLDLDRRAALRDANVLRRLIDKSAATRRELEEAQDRLAGIEAQIQAEKLRRAALASDLDIEAARARVRDAEAALKLAARRLALCTVRAPRAGVVYDLPAKAGDWVEAGALIARIGELARLKAAIFVDEPEMGRVHRGMPVTITWDALPGRQWQARVEQTPTQVAAMGTRMVGEAIALCESPNQDLPPGANINARIRAQVVENALTIPKAALRTQGDQLGVFVAANGRLEWRRIEIGAASEVKAEVKAGVRAGEAVVLPVDRPLRPGMEVTPVASE